MKKNFLRKALSITLAAAFVATSIYAKACTVVILFGP